MPDPNRIPLHHLPKDHKLYRPIEGVQHPADIADEALAALDEKKRRKPGRPKGSVTKFTANAKHAFHMAFQRIGGVRKLAEWANENPGDFYKLYARLIPVELTGHDGKALTVTFQVETKPQVVTAQAVISTPLLKASNEIAGDSNNDK